MGSGGVFSQTGGFVAVFVCLCVCVLLGLLVELLGNGANKPDHLFSNCNSKNSHTAILLTFQMSRDQVRAPIGSKSFLSDFPRSQLRRQIR